MASFRCGDAVALHLVQQVLGIVRPLQSHIAAGQTRLGNRSDVGLRTVEAQDVVVGGGCLEELTLLELRIGHHQPGMVYVGIVLLACQELFFLLRALLVALDDGTLLDAVYLDGLLAFGNGCFEVALAQARRCLVGADVHGQYLVEVVLVTLVLRLEAFKVCHLTVVERVVVSRQTMIGACGRRVLLDGTGDKQDKQHDDTHHAAPDIIQPAISDSRLAHTLYITHTRGNLLCWAGRLVVNWGQCPTIPSIE